MKTKQPCLKDALLVFISIVVILMVGIMMFKVDIHILLMMGLFITCLYSVKYGYGLDDLIKGMSKNITRAIPAMIIFLLIGMIIGSWIMAGTVPALIYYGLKILNAKYFLPMGLILCSVTSLATGTSWGTIGTIGIALMGMGMSLGIPAPIVAGMIVSGAVFGDKMSPISDTTNLAAVSARANLYDHIKAMSYTTIPSYILVMIIYYFLGLTYSTGVGNGSERWIIENTLSEHFNLHPIVLLPMVVLLILNLKKVSAIPAMSIGAFVGVGIALIFQDANVGEILNSLNNGYTKETGVLLVDDLLLRGGIQKMMSTFSLSFIALCLGGVLEEVGYLKVLIKGLLNKVKSVGQLCGLTILTTFLGNMAMGEIYLGILLSGQLYSEAFKEKGLRPEMLSRLLEEGGTMTGPLIPWTTAGAFMSATLGISVMEYAKFAFLCYINPILSIVLCFMGVFVFWKKGYENLKI